MKFDVSARMAKLKRVAVEVATKRRDTSVGTGWTGWRVTPTSAMSISSRPPAGGGALRGAATTGPASRVQAAEANRVFEIMRSVLREVHGVHRNLKRRFPSRNMRIDSSMEPSLDRRGTNFSGRVYSDADD